MAPQPLHAPWRIDYIRDASRRHDSACFLCEAVADPQEDARRLVLHRDAHGIIIMNRYPYTNGHLMVAPLEHADDLPTLTADGRTGLMELITLGERLIHAALNPQGVNIGMNIGRAAGAGLPGHLHAHLVPRWGGDVNFMDAVGQVRIIPQAIEQLYDELVATLPKVK